MKKTFITWNYIEKAINNLAEQITKSGLNITSIYGFPRGGLIPAVMLSHKLNIPLFKSGYDIMTGNVLLVDDICDTGETLEKYKLFPIAVIHSKLTSTVTPTFIYSLAKNDNWYYYPWEIEDSKTIQDYKLKQTK